MPDSFRRGRGLATITTAAAVMVAMSACSGPPSADSSGTGAATSACTATVSKNKVKLIFGVGSFSSAYWQQVLKGAQAVADSAGVPLKTYQSNFDGQTMLNTLSSALAGGGQGTAIVVDPASNAFTKPIVQAASASGARVVTLWNRPAESHPWDFGSGCWVAHTAFDGVDSGKQNTEALFRGIGKKGGIVALQGVPDDPPNKQRLYGLQEALKSNSDVQLLDTQTANWASAAAQAKVNAELAKYPNQIDGIFAANDDMAVGAVEALRAKGLAGKVAVTGSDGSIDMLNLVKSGDAWSTMKIDAYGQGAYAAAIAIASATGDVNATELPHEHRDFYLKQELVTKANAQQAIDETNNFDASKYSYDTLKANLWADIASPIDDATWIPTVTVG